MRRLLVVCLVAFLGLPLVAATPQSALYSKPNVIVYPFTANGSTLDREASSRLATIIATQMANTNQVNVVPPPPGTERKDYLTVARTHNAEYYVAGFISPLGNGVSVVEQVVSASSGIVIYSTTAQIQTYGDAAGQGDDLAVFIARHANRGLAAIGTAPPQSSPSPQPTGEAQTNLNRLFSRKKKQAATPKPAASTAAATTTTAGTAAATTSAPAAAVRNTTPPPVQTAAPRPLPIPTPPPAPAAAQTVVPAAAAASAAPRTVATAANAGYAVLAVTGPAAEATVATQRLLDRTHGERADSAAAACSSGHAPHAVLAGTLSVKPDTQFGGSSATFDLHATDCAGKTLWHRSYSNDAGGTQSALLATERAVEAAIGAYLNPPRKR